MIKRSFVVAVASACFVALPLMACPQRSVGLQPQPVDSGNDNTRLVTQTAPSGSTTTPQFYETSLYSGAVSPDAVGVVDDITLTDPSRNRAIPLKIYYPQEPGTYPVIIFSHGLGGSREGFAHLGQFLAANGYVSIHPTHIGSDTEVYRSGGRAALRQAGTNPQTWKDRAADISFILDSLPQIEADAPALKDKLDPQAVAVAGHSMGAYTAMLTAGATIKTDGTTENFADPRVKAFIAISPQGPGILGLTDQSWNQVQRPMLMISGSQDTGQFSGFDPSWRQQPFEDMPADNNKYLAVISGAEHSSYGDRADDNPAGQKIQALVRVLSLSFLDAYLKNNPDALALLQSDNLASRSDQSLTWDWK